VRDGRFTDPSQNQAGHRDAELRGGNIRVQIVNQPQQELSPAVSALSQCRDAGAAHANERELRRHKKSVSENKKKDDEDI
jgi:hypothetical protein